MKTMAMDLPELFEEFEAALRDFGLSFETRLSTLKRVNTIINKHEDRGLMHLNTDVVLGHMTDIDQRFYAGKMSKDHYHLLRRSTQRFLNFVETGSVELINPVKGSHTSLTLEFQRISDRFLASDKFHLNTRNDIRWVTNKYFAWLNDKGFDDLHGVGAYELQKFMLDCSKQFAPSSLHNIKLYLKKLYSYLYSEKLTNSPYTELLSFPVNRESKIFPALPMSEVSKLLASIDRSSKRGKRAYAVMILGAELGLRACDVANLKLRDIDWVRGEVRIVQLKTSQSAVLPLTERVGAALQDYILNARPKTTEQHMFLRVKKPHTPLKAAVTIGEIYRDCCKTAGIESGKSFHTLRRSLATAMVSNGVDVNKVAQVLCDRSIDSIKQYIAIDSQHLKLCALTFEGIVPIGGASCE